VSKFEREKEKERERERETRRSPDETQNKTERTRAHHQLPHVLHVILAPFHPTPPQISLLLFANVRAELRVQRFQNASTFRLSRFDFRFGHRRFCSRRWKKSFLSSFSFFSSSSSSSSSARSFRHLLADSLVFSLAFFRARLWGVSSVCLSVV